MKVFIVIACALAYASAYQHLEHNVVIGKNGVPIDTVEVQHARAAHLEQVAAASKIGHSNHGEEFSETKYTGSLYHGPQHIPVINKHGVPVDTIEVQYARSAHLAQLDAAKVKGSMQNHEIPVIANKVAFAAPLYHGPQHIPVIDKHGVPVETVEVQHAKAAHLAATKLAATNSKKSENYSQKDSTLVSTHDSLHKIQAYHGPQHLTVIGKDGVPVDTAEVQHARAAHLAVHDSQKYH